MVDGLVHVGGEGPLRQEGTYQRDCLVLWGCYELVLGQEDPCQEDPSLVHVRDAEVGGGLQIGHGEALLCSSRQGVDVGQRLGEVGNDEGGPAVQEDC